MSLEPTPDSGGPPSAPPSLLSPPPAPPYSLPAPTSPEGFHTLLRRVRSAQRRQLWLVGMLYGASAALLLSLAAGFVGHASPVGARLLLFCAFLAWVMVACGLGIFKALTLVGDDTRTARRIGERVSTLSHSLLSAVELERALQKAPDFSVDLANAFLKEVNDRASKVRTEEVVRARPRRRAQWAFAATIAVCALAVAMAPRRYWTGLLAAFTSKPQETLTFREPITGDIELTFRYPAYTGLLPRTVMGSGGEISAPKGTEVSIKTRADRDVERAEVIVNDEHVPLTVTPPRDLAGKFIVKGSGTYHFAFLSGRQEEIAAGPEHPIRAEADEPPKLTLLTPGEELEVDPEQKVTLKYEAADDYGLTHLELVYRLPREQTERRVRLALDDGRKTRGAHTWDLAPLKLEPGERVSYFLEAKDNDTVDGPKKGATRTHQLKVYSAAEHRREAVAKATQLWERLLTQLADRLQGADRAQPKNPDMVASGIQTDLAGMSLVNDFASTAQALLEEKDSPQELWRALSNIAEGLQRRIRSTSEFRKLYLRHVQSTGQENGLVARLSHLIEEEITELEKDVLYLESLIDRQKLLDLQDLAKELGRERRELASQIEQFNKTKDPEAREKVMAEIRQLRERIEDLMQRMAELAKGIRDEHLNSEALQEMMAEQDMSSALDDIERLMREGKTDEALAKLQELGMQMDQMVKNFDSAEEDFGQSPENAELTQKLKEFMEDLKKTSGNQKNVAEETKEIRDRYKAQLRERLKQLSKGLKNPLLEAVEALAKDYRELGPEPMGARADAPLEELQSELDTLKSALKVEDYDLAAQSAERAERASQELAMYGEQNRQMQQQIQPGSPVAKAQSAKMAERLHQNARRTEDINRKLQKLFPPPGSMMSEQDRQKLRQLAKDQAGVQKQAQGLQQKMDELSQMAPIFDMEAEEQLEQVSQRMNSAEDRLQGGDPNRGYGEQKAAQDLLQHFEQQMQQQNPSKGKGRGLPMPMYSGGGRRRGWGESQMREKVEIPDAEQHQAPKEFRQDLLDAMKQGAPDKYKDQVKRYYEELVK